MANPRDLSESKESKEQLVPFPYSPYMIFHDPAQYKLGYRKEDHYTHHQLMAVKDEIKDKNKDTKAARQLKLDSTRTHYKFNKSDQSFTDPISLEQVLNTFSSDDKKVDFLADTPFTQDDLLFVCIPTNYMQNKNTQMGQLAAVKQINFLMMNAYHVGIIFPKDQVIVVEKKDNGDFYFTWESQGSLQGFVGEQIGDIKASVVYSFKKNSNKNGWDIAVEKMELLVSKDVRYNIINRAKDVALGLTFPQLKTSYSIDQILNYKNLSDEDIRKARSETNDVIKHDYQYVDDFFNKINALIPFLNDPTVRAKFYDQYILFPFEVKQRIDKMILNALTNKELGATLVIDNFDQEKARVLHIVNSAAKSFPQRISDLSQDIFNKDKRSAWSYLFNFYKIIEFIPAFFETLFDYTIDRSLYSLEAFDKEQERTKRGFAWVGLILAVPLYYLFKVTHQTIMRLTSPVRSFNEAYAFGAQYGGKPAGWVAAGLSAAVSLGLMAVASVFLAPFIAAVLTKMGLSAVVGGANTAVNAVSSTFIGTAAGGVASVSMGVISSVGMTVSLVWGGLVAAWEGLKYAGKKLGSTSSITPSSPVTTQASKSKLEVDVGGGSTRDITINGIPPANVVSSPTRESSSEDLKEFDNTTTHTNTTSTSSTPSPSQIEEPQRGESRESNSSSQTEGSENQDRPRSRSFGSNP